MPEPSVPEAVARFLADEVGYRKPVAADVSLFDQRIVDSIAVVSLAAFLEETFAIELEFLDMVRENFETVNAISTLVQRKRAG
jgi:acyl carrier protein